MLFEEVIALFIILMIQDKQTHFAGKIMSFWSLKQVEYILITKLSQLYVILRLVGQHAGDFALALYAVEETWVQRDYSITLDIIKASKKAEKTLTE
jgi:hypothetical protein